LVETLQLDFLKLKGKLIAKQYHLKFTTEEWVSLEDVKNIYHPDSQLHRPDVSPKYKLKNYVDVKSSLKFSEIFYNILN